MRNPPAARRRDARSLDLPSAYSTSRPARDAWGPPAGASAAATSAASAPSTLSVMHRSGPCGTPAAGRVDLRSPRTAAAVAAAPPCPPPPTATPSLLPYLPPEILVLVFSAVGWLALPTLRGVCREWRDAADHAREQVGAVRASDVARRREGRGGKGESAPSRAPPTHLSPAQVLSALHLFPALRSLCLSPGRRPAGRGGSPSVASTAAAAARSPYRGPSTRVVAALLRVFPTWLGGSLEVLDLSDVGNEPIGDDGRWPPAASVLRPAAFRVLSSPDSHLRDLRVARCSWWGDDHVAATVSLMGSAAAAEERKGVLHTLTMPATAVTRTGLVTAWAAAIANVDVSWCKGVSGRLELLPLQGARSDVKPFVASAMSLTLCGTRLYGLTITSPPRPGTTLAVNASHCVHLQDVVLPSKETTTALFSGCAALVTLMPVVFLLAGVPGAAAGAGPAVAAGVSAHVLPHLRTLSLFGCRFIALSRLSFTAAATPALESLNVNGVLSLTELLVDGLPALEAVDAAGCRDLTRVSVRGCPALTRVDLRGKKSPMTSVHVSLAGGGVVLGVRGSWEVWESKESVRVDHGE